MKKIIFVSNYLNHHQIPFCNAMYELLDGSFLFIQTEPMDEERIQMGWNEKNTQPYLKFFYEEPGACKKLILDAGIVIFGGCDDEGYIEERLNAGKPVIRYSERLYKTGQWKAVSPRGLRKKYHDHTRYRKAQVYLLCAGAYVASDYSLIHAYPKKKFCWGYFPETKHYDIDKLLEQKGWGEDRERYLLWSARMIDWKHPELAVETARYLKEKGYSFRMDIIGGGTMEEEVRALAEKYDLGDCVGFPGFLKPEQVREYMEKADIFLFTSDRQEGWGAVANEAMNSGCALVADHMIGAIPYLVQDGVDGLIYKDGNPNELFALAERLVCDRELCRKLGRRAYAKITESWNAVNAAKRLVELCRELGLLGEGAAGDHKPETADAGLPMPGAPAPVIPERKIYRLLKRGKWID